MYSPREFAGKLNITERALTRLDIEGVLKAQRTVEGKKYYTDEEYGRYTGGYRGEGEGVYIYKPNEFASLIKVTVRTLQKWDTKGILKAKRTITGRRYYTEEDYKKCTGEVLSDIQPCYKPNEFAKLVGVSVSKLEDMERRGLIKAKRVVTGRKFYTEEEYKRYMKMKNIKGIRRVVNEREKSKK